MSYTSTEEMLALNQFAILKALKLMIGESDPAISRELENAITSSKS